MDEEKLRFALDTQSPEDIDVISIELVADDFHCRYAKHSKTYEFIVDRGRPKNPMRRHYATHFPYPLDVERMQIAAKKLEGTHDFTGFTASGTSVEDKVRTITEASLRIDETGQFLTFTFQEMVSCISRFAIWWERCSKSETTACQLSRLT